MQNISRQELRKALNQVRDMGLLKSNPSLPRLGYQTIVAFPTNLVKDALKTMVITRNQDDTFNLNFNY